MVRPLAVQNTALWLEGDFTRRDLYTSDVILGTPAPDSLVVDLSGYTIFPGLVNAHDHLELNHYPRTKFREVYDNAHQWGEDVNARLNTSPFKELRAFSLWDRLFIGGLKNLLCGATTVAHHGPPHKEMFRKDFPVRVWQRYGWAHSLHFDRDEEVVASYRNTPPDVPWFIHLAEGTDEIAASEYQRLKALGCIGKNTVIVHGVGLTESDIKDAASKVRGLLWCPSTNLYLLNATLKIDCYQRKYSGTVTLGSDSCLTADGDLLDELRCAVTFLNIDCHNQIQDALINMVTTNAVKIIDANLSGHLGANAHADFIALADHTSLIDTSRSDLALVMIGGIPQIGNPELMAKFPHIETVESTLDGVPKAIHIDLARRIQKCKLKEPGLALGEMPKRRRFIF